LTDRLIDLSAENKSNDRFIQCW